MGDVLSDFPIELLGSHQPTLRAVMVEKKSERVLGFRIDETFEDPAATAAGAGTWWIPAARDLTD